ncbi:hypothetical protein [Arthrobacter sp. Y-9]|uniref:hypothetical protein n=1 Tax=Arthrobacter sp. Y-9 TaxID=3039385 RepID=UPI00241E57BC|nr:hypothetical protein [Arthrobacter sp. Y-9]WFR83085.1 hypothetical protein P9849_11010 [Arthrobacter sp. Y-9]
MDIQNHFYGHSAVLAGFAGLTRPRHFQGLLQHGWTPVTPIRTHFADLAGSAPAGNLFTWTHDSRGWTEEESFRETGFHSTPIGAPALYLADMVEKNGERPTPTLDTVVFPFHGTRLVAVEGDQAAYAREIYEKEGPALVCMHIDDLQRPDVVAAWRDAGHRLTTAGERRDPDFLARVLWLIMNAKKVVSNRLATALVYAAAVGTPIEIYGPHFQIAGIQEESSEEYLRKLWPEFYDPNTDLAALKSLARAELGADAMRSPDELRDLLGWNGPNYRAAFHYWLGAPLAKAAAILGLKKREVGPVVNAVKVSPWHFVLHPVEHLPDRLTAQVSRHLVAPDLDIQV